MAKEIAGNRVSFVAAATPAILYPRGTSLPQRTLRLKRIMAYNGQAADVILEIGTGVAPFVRILPRITLVTGFHFIMDERECPGVKFEADITGQVSAAAAVPNDIEVQLTVEEEG